MRPGLVDGGQPLVPGRPRQRLVTARANCGSAVPHRRHRRPPSWPPPNSERHPNHDAGNRAQAAFGLPGLTGAQNGPKAVFVPVTVYSVSMAHPTSLDGSQNGGCAPELDNVGGLYEAAKRTSEVRSQAAWPRRVRCRARSSRLPRSPVAGGSRRGVPLRLPGCRSPRRRPRCRRGC
jgi:hypothetical protein